MFLKRRIDICLGTLDADQVKESAAMQSDRVQRLRIGNDDPIHIEDGAD